MLDSKNSLCQSTLIALENFFPFPPGPEMILTNDFDTENGFPVEFSC